MSNNRPGLRLTPVPHGYMVPTAGPRDESCRRYDDCLTAHVFGHRPRKLGAQTSEDRERGEWASCPAGCRWREARLERATDFAYHPDGGHLARAVGE